ncbi:MAG TPA: phospholipid carrier-dependent glycosyltransferase [Candidatus Limnocylindria bacterium]|nr:phospholipid carrier-dependent glycosyltransferase [Candidatus Limnocylindria bacterium]
MTTPRAVGADRTLGARRARGARTAVGSLAILLLVGLLLRLTIAYVLLPGSGFETDISSFVGWALQLAKNGPGTFYGAGFADYPPGYLYVLWILGGLGGLLAPLAHGDTVAAVTALIKIPPILLDIAVGALLFYIVRKWRENRPDADRLALIAAALYVLNPVTWYDSAVWGQVDASGAFILLLTVAALMRGNSEGATILAVVAALIKPQFGIVALPVVGIVLLRRHLFRPGSNPRNPVLLPQRLRSWFEGEDGFWRIISSAVAGLVVLLALLAPFSMDVVRFFNQMTGTAAGYPWLSVNAYNAWALIGAGGAQPLASGGGWSSDTVGLLGPLPGVLVGGILLALGFAVGVLRLAWQDDRRSIVAVTIFLALAFFMLPTRVHERYMFPIFGLLPLLAVVDRRWMIATIALSIAAFINLHGILTIDLYATPNLEHLPFGELFRQPLGILVAIFLNVFGFVLVALQLRPSVAARRAAAPVEADVLPEGAPAEPAAQTPWSTRRATFGDGRTAPTAAGAAAGGAQVAMSASAAAAAVAPSPAMYVEPEEDIELTDYQGPAEPSMWQRWVSTVVDRPSVRRDRSALLVNERGGRLDRRDLALLLIVFFASLFLRTYRLEVPYGPHFDEVYHARTAVEFLQDWRYDMPHSIYEFTHPHLAKYAMAWGITLLGNNRVMDTRELSTAVTDAVTEVRWSPTGRSDLRSGDRLYVATGTDVGVYDLATRAEVVRLAFPATAMALDDTSHTLYLANSAGGIYVLSTSLLDTLRTDPDSAVPQPGPFAQTGQLEGSVTRIAVTGGQLLLVSDGGSVVSFDLTGVETSHTLIAGADAIVGVPPRSTVMADPAQIPDAQAYAQTLAGLMTEDPAGILSALSAANGQRTVIEGDLGAAADDVQEAIDDGRLPGTVIETRPMVAISRTIGISLLDAATLFQIELFPAEQAVGGMALVSRGPDVPTIYAASGSQLLLLRLASDGQVAFGSALTMPNVVQDVRWNEATTNIHVLGLAQHATTPTVYVVEPRSNAVYADAPLTFTPRALVMDVQPDRPAEDRDDLLALSDTGQIASIDVGNNQFAYRFPGVLVASLMAVCIYLLARFLSARRAVALIVALLVLADGMFFANARIAMNDTYVAFFIVAAMTLFVPLWLGRWSSKRALIAGFIGVGLLLGLAFASKWVGLYAMGGVGLLILIRSALGRWIALLAMIGMTSLLGYIAITPATTAANPSLNYLFLFVMVGLTVLLALAMALRPMRFSLDELRLGALAALLPGPLLLAYGLYKTAQGGLPVLGTFLTPARLIQLGLGLTAVGVLVVAGLWLAGRRGYGPLAHRLVAQGETPAEPPAPRGWLRPGSGFLGLPWLLALGAVLLLPIGVYILSYIPWINLGNHWGLPFFPAGTEGQAFLDLQKSMYDYHNNLRATHPASSPWWAWLLDLKPVWFEQSDYAGGTTAVIYDTGNLVAFWLAIPAIVWTCWQAWKRRSLPLTFIAVAIASLWLPWARIDRATFQYHIFTTLPFTFLALAYFLAELWHGPSRGTWAVARVGAAIAIIGAPLLWLLRQPLCGLANTQSVNPNTEVCGALGRTLTLTDIQVVGLGLAILGLIAAGVIVYLSSNWTSDEPRPAFWSLLLPVAFSVSLFGVAFAVVGAALPGNPVFQLPVQAEAPALVALVLLAVPAYFVLKARDPRKFVVGALAAAVIWFVAFYPNIASLPVPTPLSQVHLGLLPTWNWGFQFGVNRDPAASVPTSWTSVLMLAVAVVGLCVAAVYASRSWNAARNSGGDEVSGLPETG